MNKRIFLFFFLALALIAKSQPIKYIVASDGTGDFISVQSAIDACPDGNRSFIFIKNGTYYGQTTIGSKASSSSKLISLIGENRDSVILTFDKSLNTVTTFEDATTFQIYAKNFYAENVTFQNSAGNTGQALSLYTAGDMSVFKNCALKGYQDTYRSKKGTRGYFLNCWIEGAVDFIYAGGTLFFDDCTIYCIKSGGYITAPEDAYATVPKSLTEAGAFIRLGFIFRNCQIYGPSSVPSNSFYLGRPWGDYAGTIYLNCKLSNQVNAAGWSTMGSSTYLTSFFAEYNSMDLNETPLDISNRVSWSFQLTKNDVDNLLTTTAVYARSFSTLFDPITFCIQPQAPKNISIISGTISWDAIPDVAGYLIYKKDCFLTAVTENYFSDNTNVADLNAYTFYSISVNGVLSEPGKVITGFDKAEITEISVYQNGSELIFSQPVKCEVYNKSGMMMCTSNNQLVKTLDVKNFSTDFYIINYRTTQNEIETLKFQIKKN